MRRHVVWSKFVRPALAAGALLLAAAAVPGCAPWQRVPVRMADFSSGLEDTTQSYRGLVVSLDSFVNDAWDTDSWYYFAEGRRICWSPDASLDVYLERGVATGLRRVDVTVLEGPRSDVPELDLTFTRWSDVALHFQIRLRGADDSVFEQSYELRFDAPALRERELAEHGYAQLDAVVAVMLNDPAFYAALVAGQSSSGAGPRQVRVEEALR